MRTMRAFRLRRLVWRARRNVPRVAQPLSALLPTFPAPRKPILLIGCPRSGTSVLLQTFLESRELRSIQSEGHVLWDAYHDPHDRGWDSDALRAADVLEREREYIYCAITLFVRRRRFIDKTPANCLRIPYLDALFPDATFVFLRRRAADNVNSLIEGWRARPRFVKHTLPERLDRLGELSGHSWSFVLIPGWRDLRSASLEEICARQYVACNEAALAARASVEDRRWIDVGYEDLVRSPLDELARVFEGLDLAFTNDVARFAAALDRTPAPTALTAPRPDKWRDQNPDAIRRILPLVAETERRLGYDPQAVGSSP